MDWKASRAVPRTRPPGPFTAGTIGGARDHMALIIAGLGPDGEIFLPIFARLEAEHQAAVNRDAMLARVRTIAGGVAA